MFASFGSSTSAITVNSTAKAVYTLQKRVGIDDRASCYVDQNGGSLQQTDTFAVD